MDDTFSFRFSSLFRQIPWKKLNKMKRLSTSPCSRKASYQPAVSGSDYNTFKFKFKFKIRKEHTSDT